MGAFAGSWRACENVLSIAGGSNHQFGFAWSGMLASKPKQCKHLPRNSWIRASMFAWRVAVLIRAAPSNGAGMMQTCMCTSKVGIGVLQSHHGGGTAESICHFCVCEGFQPRAHCR